MKLEFKNGEVSLSSKDEKEKEKIVELFKTTAEEKSQNEDFNKVVENDLEG